MKKRIAFLTALFLVLTSCTAKQTVPDTSEKASQQPTDTTTPVFYIDGELPDIGSFKSSPERYYEDYTPTFIPSKEYGRIIPYTGKYKEFRTSGADENNTLKMGYHSLGFCDANGKIIMDANSRNMNVQYIQSNDGFGLYTLLVTENPEAEQPDDVYIPQKSYIIPESGEWCIVLDQYSWMSEVKNGVISVITYPDDGSSRGECILYDYNGKEISRLGYYDNLQLSDYGLICAMRWDGDNSFHGYIDMDGNVVLGPYKSVNPFNSVGVAIVEEDDGFYLIDPQGNQLSGVYENITEYKKDYKDGYGVYIARHRDNRNISDVLDEKGNISGTMSGNSYYNLRFLPDGDIVYYYNNYDTDKMVWKRLSDNSDLICLETGTTANQYSGDDDFFVYTDEETKLGYVFDSNGETVLKAENFFDLRYVSENRKYLVYAVGEGYTEYYDEEEQQWISENDIETYFYNLETKESKKLCDGDSATVFIGEDDRYVSVGYSKSTVVFGDFDSYRLFDSESGEIIFDNCRNIFPNQTGNGTYITVCTDNSCTLYDENLKQIIKTYND